MDAMFFIVTPDATELARLARLVDEGKLRPGVSQVFPLRDGRQAFESATPPHPPGKTVLRSANAQRSRPSVSCRLGREKATP